MWLTTYRINFEKDKAAVQAWAHVDNVTLNDWKDVHIELRSGKPRTFHVDIMSPIMINRETLYEDVFGIASSMDTYTPFDNLAIKASQFGQGKGKGGGFGGGFGFGGGMGGGGGYGGAGGGTFGEENDEETESETALDLASSFRTKSGTSKSLQSVNFRIKEPISIAASQSSAIPIISQELPGELLSQFDANQTDDNAAHVLMVTNETKFPLLPGPASTFVAGEFVGETTIPRVPLDAKQALSYGTDQSVTVSRQKDAPKRTDTSVKLDQDKAVATIASTIRTPMKFSAQNQSDRTRKVAIRIPFDQNDKAQTLDPSPIRFDEDMAIYEIEVKGIETKQLEINWVQKVTKKMTLKTAAADHLLVERWKRANIISDADGKALEAIH